MNVRKLSVSVVVCLVAVLFALPSASASQMVLSNTKAELYGFVRTDFIYDDAANKHGELLSWTDSEGDNDDNFYATTRFSRIGIDFENGNISAKVEGDFYGDMKGGQAAFRMRHFYVKAD